MASTTLSAVGSTSPGEGLRLTLMLKQTGGQDSAPASPLIKAGRRGQSVDIPLGEAELSRRSADSGGSPSTSVCITSLGVPEKSLDAQITSAQLVMAFSSARTPCTVIAAINLLAKINQVGVGGNGMAGLMPDALKVYVQGPLQAQHHLPLQAVIDTIVRWGLQQMRSCHDRPMTQQEIGRLLELTLPVLEAFNLQALKSAVEPSCLLTGQDILNATKRVQESQVCNVQLQQKSFWQIDDTQTGINLINLSTVICSQSMGNNVLKSVMCLSSGKWVWSIKISGLGAKPAWIGLADACKSVSGISKPENCLMLGTNGLLRFTKDSQTSSKILSLPLKGKRSSELTVKVFVDMDAHTCAYSTNGKFLGVAFQNLPHFVWPALSLPAKAKAEFIYMDAKSSSVFEPVQISRKR